MSDVIDRTAPLTGAVQSPSTLEPGPRFVHAIRDVIVIASSSRSGSSFLAEMLQPSRALLHFAGEINPLLRLSGLSWPDSGSGSDSLSAEHAAAMRADALDPLLAYEAGEPADGSHDTLDEEFVRRLFWRLTLQWPDEALDEGQVRQWAAGAFADVGNQRGRVCDWSQDLHLFHGCFLRRVRQAHPAVNPYCYDVDRTILAALFPGVEPPPGAPAARVVEEPPFVLIRPWRRPDDWRQRPLVIKSPSNAYRLTFLRALFPNARIRILYLTRNPAASINGLCDGWRHWGFHSHFIGADLQLRGYAQDRVGDQGWWKFDLPPQWPDYLDSTLEQVCAFQWCAAQEAILDFVHRTGTDCLRVKFETLITGSKSTTQVLAEIHDWCGLSGPTDAAPVTRPIMAVVPPRPGRWRSRRESLTPVLQSARLRALAADLGYADEAHWV